MCLTVYVLTMRPCALSVTCCSRLLRSAAPATGDDGFDGHARLEAIEEEETVRMHITALRREEVALQASDAMVAGLQSRAITATRVTPLSQTDSLSWRVVESKWGREAGRWRMDLDIPTRVIYSSVSDLQTISRLFSSG